MHEIEPYFGWLKYYSGDRDEKSPFFGEEYDQFYYNRQVYEHLAHPQWDSIDSDSLLVKILHVDYEKGYAIIEMFGVWNDLLQNDYKLLSENCLSILVHAGINKVVLIMENILNVYVEEDDYYEALQDELEDGWICLVRAREHVQREFTQFDLDQYFFWSEEIDDLFWRKLKPWELFAVVESRMRPLLR